MAVTGDVIEKNWSLKVKTVKIINKTKKKIKVRSTGSILPVLHLVSTTDVDSYR